MVKSKYCKISNVIVDCLQDRREATNKQLISIFVNCHI